MTTMRSFMRELAARHGDGPASAADTEAELREVAEELAAEAAVARPDAVHDEEDSYGRDIFLATPFLEILVMTWKPGDYSAIHDHGTAEWGLVLVLDEYEHARFTATDGVLTTVSRDIRPRLDLNRVTPSLIHQMGNVGSSTMRSVHVYGRSDASVSDAVTADTHLYAPWQSTTTVTDGPAFYPLALAGAADGPPGDAETSFRDAIELAARLARVVIAGDDAVQPSLQTVITNPAVADGLRRLRSRLSTSPSPSDLLDGAAVRRLADLLSTLEQRQGAAAGLASSGLFEELHAFDDARVNAV